LRGFPSSDLCRATPRHQPVAARELEPLPLRLTHELLLRATLSRFLFREIVDSTFRAGQDLRSRTLPRRRMRSRKSGCLPPLRRPFGYVRITPHVRSDSISSSRRPALRFCRTARRCSLHQSGIATEETSAFGSIPARLSPDGPSETRWLGGDGC